MKNEIFTINNIFSKNNVKIIAQYISENGITDNEPYSNSPFRGSVSLDDILRVDETFHNRIQTIIKKRLDGEFYVASITCHFKHKWLGAQEHWHQDYIYNKLIYDGKPSDFYRLFIAIDDHTKRNGCLLTINNASKQLQHDEILNSNLQQKYRIKPFELDNLYSKHGIQYNEIKAGQGLLFSSLIPHASCSNQTQLPRKAITVQLVRKDTKKYTEDQRSKIMKDRRLFEIEELMTALRKKNEK